MLKKIFNKFYILIIFIPLILTRDIYDNDFWFTINHGRYILEKGFTNIEPFTVHNNLAFTFEKWLTSIIFYVFHEWFDGTGMYIFLIIMFSLILLAMYITMKTLSKNTITSIFFTVIFGFSIVEAYITLRPQIFSFLILIIEFYLLEKYIQTNNNKYLYILPILSWFYFQLHSTMWIMFFIMLMPYIFDFNIISRFINCEESNYKKSPILIIGMLSFFVGFFNPYGSHSILYLFKSMNVFKYPIEELQVPNDIIFYERMMIFIAFEIFYFLNQNLNKAKFIPLRYLYCLIGTLILGVIARRNIAYFQIYHAIICCYMFKDLKLNCVYKYSKIINILAITVFLGVLYNISDKQMLVSGGRAEKLIDNLQQELNCNYYACQNVTLYTDFNTGSYAEWKGFKTYIDPRAEVFLKKINNKEDILQEWFEIYYIDGDYKEIENKHKFDYWLITNASKMSEKIEKDNSYVLIDQDENFKLYKYTKEN